MLTERLDVRLDPERRRKLRDIAKDRGLSVSSVMRQAIDLLYEQALRNRRLRAAKAIAAMEIEDLPEPEELARQLNEAHDSPLP